MSELWVRSILKNRVRHRALRNIPGFTVLKFGLEFVFVRQHLNCLLSKNSFRRYITVLVPGFYGCGSGHTKSDTVWFNKPLPAVQPQLTYLTAKLLKSACTVCNQIWTHGIATTEAEIPLEKSGCYTVPRTRIDITRVPSSNVTSYHR